MKQKPHYNSKNGFLPMPEEFCGMFFNASTEPCDMLVGPCSCGAWHYIHEWPMEVREKMILQYPELEQQMEEHLAKYPWCIKLFGYRKIRNA